MLIREILKNQNTTLSFEFFPPKNEENSKQLFETIHNLTPLKPAYVSVTYGAGGSTRDLTHNLVTRLRKETNIEIVSHLTCVGSTQDEIKSILERYEACDIHNIMALRGDPPKGETEFKAPVNGFERAADLVRFIKKNFPKMGIGVAGFPEGHPECSNRLKEMDYLKAKIDEGADYICTQLFFDNRDFYDFKERCELAGINVPIIAGIMPVRTKEGVRRMADLAARSRFPARLLKMLSRAESDFDIAQIGLHWATEQVNDLLHHDVKGIHFYTLNRSSTTIEIYKNLGIKSSDSLNKKNNFF